MLPHALASLILLLEVHGAGACPAPAAVEDRLRALGRPAADGGVDRLPGPPDEARVEEHPDGTLEVTLVRAGTVRARKTFPASVDCSERADIAAIALAIWEERVRSGVSLDVDGIDAAAPTAPRPVPTRATAASLPTALEVVAAPDPLDRAGRVPWIESVGVGVLGVARGPTAGARIDVRGATASGWWRPRLSVAALGSERLEFTPGEASWRRLFGVAGAELILWRRPVSGGKSPAAWALSGGVGAILGWLNVSGQGFADNRASSNVDAGAELGLRFEAGLAPWRPWLGVSVFSWLRGQDVTLAGVTEARSLPAWDVALALGVDFLPNW